MLSRFGCFIFSGIIAIAGVIEGSVTDLFGSSLAGVRVNLIGIETGLRRSTVSTGSGTYSFGDVPPGKYRLLFEQQGFSGREVLAESNQRAEPISVALSVGLLAITRTHYIRGSVAGKYLPRTGVVVTAFAEYNDSIRITGKTDWRGRFALQVVHPGIYRLKAEGKGHGLAVKCRFSGNSDVKVTLVD